MYFIKHKWQAFEEFVKFKQQVERQLELKLKCLKTNKGGEFIGGDFQRFCEKRGHSKGVDNSLYCRVEQYS